MSDTEAEREFSRGLRFIQHGHALAALTCFEKACSVAARPEYFSYLGFCIAKERGQVQKGIQLCSEALENEPENGVHYLNLGRIYLTAGNKQEAIRVFRKGLAYGPNAEISGALDAIGTRNPVVFSFLSRQNPINKYLGIMLRKLGLR